MSTSETAAKPPPDDHAGAPHDLAPDADFLARMALRWQLGAVRFALDVGAGAGDWGRLLLPHLAAEARMLGVDREPASIREAHHRAERAGVAGRLSYRLGDAEHLPFHDGVFGLVTCQTVLLHLRYPYAALHEMIRVLQPGGLVAVASPPGEARDAIDDRLPYWLAEAGLEGVAAAEDTGGSGVRYLVAGRRKAG